MLSESLLATTTTNFSDAASMGNPQRAPSVNKENDGKYHTNNTPNNGPNFLGFLSLEEFHLLKQEFFEWWHLSWVSGLRSFLELLPWMVSLIIMGHYGTNELAALSLVEVWIYTFMTVAWEAVAMTNSILVSQAHGQQSLYGMRGWASMSLVVMTSCNIVITALCLTTKPALLAFGFDKKLVDDGSDYATYIIPAMFLEGINVCACTYLTGFQEVKRPLIIAIITVMIDIPTTYFFIFGGVFPPLLGSAMGWMLTSLCGVLMNLLVVYSLWGKELYYAEPDIEIDPRLVTTRQTDSNITTNTNTNTTMMANEVTSGRNHSCSAGFEGKVPSGGGGGASINNALGYRKCNDDDNDDDEDDDDDDRYGLKIGNRDGNPHYLDPMTRSLTVPGWRRSRSGSGTFYERRPSFAARAGKPGDPASRGRGGTFDDPGGKVHPHPQGGIPRTKKSNTMRHFLCGNHRKNRWNSYMHIFLPTAATVSSYNFCYLIVSFLASRLGLLEIAAHNINISLLEVILAAVYGMGEGTGVRVGYHIGAGNIAGAKRVCVVAIVTAATFASVVCIIGYSCRYEIASFLSSDADVRDVTVTLSPILWLSYFIYSVGGQALAILDGQGRTKEQAFASMVGSWAVTVPVAFLSFYASWWIFNGLVGIWLSLLTGYIVIVTIACYHLLRSDWEDIVNKSRSMLKEEEDALLKEAKAAFVSLGVPSGDEQEDEESRGGGSGGGRDGGRDGYNDQRVVGGINNINNNQHNPINPIIICNPITQHQGPSDEYQLMSSQ